METNRTGIGMLVFGGRGGSGVGSFGGVDFGGVSVGSVNFGSVHSVGSGVGGGNGVVGSLKPRESIYWRG